MVNTKRLHMLSLLCLASALGGIVFFSYQRYTILAILIGLLLWLSMIFRNEYWFNELYDRVNKE